MRKRRLYTPFKIATQTSPKTAEGMEIVDQGFWGCVARKPDGNLRKFAFRMVDPAKQEAAEAEIRAEWQNLYLLNSNIPSSHMKYFVEGFVETSGIDVPEEMLDIIATKRHASGASSADAHVREHSVRELHIRLSRLNHITGLNF